MVRGPSKKPNLGCTLQANVLKGQIRQLSESRDAEIKTASDGLREKLQELTTRTNRSESIVRSARANASKSQAECQVLLHPA